jgi:hypothetical protein
MTSEPDQIRTDIERTQQDLSANVDALTDKISPPRIVHRQVTRTRTAVGGVKDKIMGTTSQTSSGPGSAVGSAASSAKDTVSSAASSAADAASSAPEQARQRTQGNPIAAGLIAFGAGWLLSSLLPASEPEQQMATQVKDLATEKGRPIAQELSQAGQEAAQELRESAQQKAQTVKETAAGAAATVKDEAQSSAGDVQGRAQQAQQRVTDQAGPDGS